jgi:hypothetical protein
MISTLNLKDDFNDIKIIRDSTIYLIESLDNKIEILKNIYQNLLSNNTSHCFGLDSLHFQNKIIQSEYEFILKQFKIIDNRIYGDYYKLYQIINNYLINNINDKKIINLTENSKNYPIYKDLNNEFEYDFINTTEIHKDIIQIIEALQNELLIRERDLKIDDKKRESGLNIDNLINSYNYNNTLLKEQISLFIDYIKVFHKFHVKYMYRFNLRIKLFYSQIESDIKLEKKNDIDINNIKTSNDISKLNFSDEEQKKIISLTRSNTLSNNKFNLTTKNILNTELNNIFNNSAEINNNINNNVNYNRLLKLYK